MKKPSSYLHMIMRVSWTCGSREQPLSLHYTMNANGSV
jgi:hypothetical protein